MRKSIFSLIAVVSSTVLAHAADLPRAQPAPVPAVVSTSIYNWTGFYIGGNIGGAWADIGFDHNLGGVGWSTDRSGFIGGAQAGYNWQFGPFVLGVEGDFDWTDISRTSGVAILPGFGPLQARGDWDWTASLAGRYGLAVDRLLYYVKLGAGWSKTSATLHTPAGVIVASSNNTSVGVLAGAGVEWAFAYNWSAKLEYNYLALEDRTFIGPLVARFNSFERIG